MLSANDLLIASGFSLLNLTKTLEARRSFERALAQGASTADLWFGLSCTYRLMGDVKAEGEALERALRINSSHLQALIAQADWEIAHHRIREAISTYHAAVEIAGAQSSLPPGWHSEVERARKILSDFSASYQMQLLTKLQNKGLGSPGSERFGRAIDILFGRQKPYASQPTHFYFPELSHKQFFERGEFSWAREFETRTDAIREELKAILASGDSFSAYQAVGSHRHAGGVTGDKSWSVYSLIDDGQEMSEHVARCPHTMAALKELPLFRVGGCAPSIMFSLLAPGARIVPHHGLTNARLICHLPLIVPPNCGNLRVGNELRPWTEGELLIFDDSIEHEAWNASTSERAVLLFDVWRPELSAHERDLVATLFSVSRQFNRF